jgi:hypothetical protein
MDEKDSCFGYWLRRYVEVFSDSQDNRLRAALTKDIHSFTSGGMKCGMVKIIPTTITMDEND